MTQPNRRDFVLIVQAVPILGPDLPDALANSAANALAGADCPASGPALPRDALGSAGERATQAGQVG